MDRALELATLVTAGGGAQLAEGELVKKRSARFSEEAEVGTKWKCTG
jgi:hypothetical protein